MILNKKNKKERLLQIVMCYHENAKSKVEHSNDDILYHMTYDIFYDVNYENSEAYFGIII